MLKTLCHIVVSPFGQVKFKDFFMADIMTSMVPTIRDIVMTVFLIGSGQWMDLSKWGKYLDPNY